MDFTEGTAAEMAALVREGTTSPVELVRASLDRIAATDSSLRAFQGVRADRAIEEARALEQHPNLSQMPLAGVPIAIKDNVDVEGEPTRDGTLARSSAPAASDDLLIKRLREAGCVVVGKTRVPELCLFHFTESQAFGVTRNAWDQARGSGGSSGGSAVAVAAGMVPVALAADGLGSIRIPSAWNGVFGIKPGAGVVPRATAVDDWFGLSEWGPMATTVLDAALVLDALAGTDVYARQARQPQRLRVGVSLRPPATGVRVDAEIRGAVEASADALRAAGNEIVVIDPPYRQRLAIDLLKRWLAATARESRNLDFEKLESRTQAMARLGEWVERHHPVTEDAAVDWRRRMTDWFAAERLDAVLLPSTARTAPPLGRWENRGWLATILGGTMYAPFAAPWNLAGLPAASVPARVSRDGRPIGVQLVAPPGGEGRILGLASQLEEAISWSRHAPSHRGAVVPAIPG